MARRKSAGKKTESIDFAPSVEPPTTAAVLIAVGGILIIASALIWASIGNAASGPNPLAKTANQTTLQNMQAVTQIGQVTETLGILGVILGILVVISAVKINTSDKAEIKKWSKIAIIAAIISLTSIGGFIIGTGFAVLGGIIGLAAKEY